MGIGRIARAGRVARCGQGGLADKHTILTITDNGAGAGRVTVAAPHGFIGGEVVTISGNSDSNYNKAGVNIDGVPSPTTFDSGDLTYDVDGTGGSWVQTG